MRGGCAGGNADEDNDDDNEDQRHLAAAVLFGAALTAQRAAGLSDPEDAVKDLVELAKTQRRDLAIASSARRAQRFSRSGDPDQDAENLKDFNKAAAEITAIDDGADGRTRVGKNGWTLPLPLVKTDAGWRFDPVRGKEEMTNRRIGFDEFSAIAACRAYVDAQNEYIRLDRDGNGLREYAAKSSRPRASTTASTGRRRARPTSHRSMILCRTQTWRSARTPSPSLTTATTSRSSPHRAAAARAAPTPISSTAT